MPPATPAAVSAPFADARRRRRTVTALCVLVAVVVAALVLHGPIAQPAGYHGFADTRAWLGVPNAADVLSNLPFALAGVWGWLALARLAHRASPARRAWRVFAAALVATAFGSAWYHLAPNDQRLVFDRIPIAWACVAVLAAFAAERFTPRAARADVLALGLLLATASVLWWWWTGRSGVGDLRPYLVVQGLPMLVVPAALLLGARPRGDGVAPDAAWWGVLGAYALAKFAEAGDAALWSAGGEWISGHTLKHLLAAAGAAWLLRGAVRAARAVS